MTKLGFTGSRGGLTDRQSEVLAYFVAAINPTEAHHGDCVGADLAFHEAVRRHSPETKIVVHPPDNAAAQANCVGDESQEPLPYLERNAAIVGSSERLLACPKEATEAMRSGTWATVRLAKKQGKPVMLILPNGAIERR